MKVKFFGCDAEAAPDNTSYCIQNFFCVFFSWTKQKQEEDEKEKSEMEERERGRGRDKERKSVREKDRKTNHNLENEK